jgi:DivIVA domain-containing protein
VFVLEVLVAVAVLAAVALAAAGRFDGLAEEDPDDPDIGVPPDRPLRSTDVPRLRFRLAIRGYRMSDVDAAMGAVQEALRVSETQSTTPGQPPVPPAPTPHPPLQPEPLPPSPPAPPTPEPFPSPEPPVADAAEQPPTDVEERPLSDLEASTDDARAGDSEEPTPSPASWQLPPIT